MGQPPRTRDAILALLSEHPEGLCYSDIADELDISHGAVESSIYNDRAQRGTTNFRVLKYRPVRGKGGRFQPLFVAGPGEDAKRPRVANKRQNARARDARYRERNRAVIRAKTNARRARARGRPGRPTSPFAGLL